MKIVLGCLGKLYSEYHAFLRVPLCDLCVSVVDLSFATIHHRDTENSPRTTEFKFVTERCRALGLLRPRDLRPGCMLQCAYQLRSVLPYRAPSGRHRRSCFRECD